MTTTTASAASSIAPVPNESGRWRRGCNRDAAWAVVRWTRRRRNPVIDTLNLARTCVRGAPSCRLEDLVVHLGLAESEDHRALSDSRLAIAYCHAAEMEKTYRLDRIREIHAAETWWPVGMCWLPGEPNGGSAVVWAKRSA